MKIKHISIWILSMIITLSPLLFTQTTYADIDRPYRMTCQEIMNYYDTSLPGVESDSFDENLVEQDCTNLTGHHETFPGQHVSEIDPNEHPTPNRESHQPRSIHKHTYINMSEESPHNDGTITYKNTKLDTFELQLQDDFLNNIILDEVVCSQYENELGDGNNCVGSGNAGIRTVDGQDYLIHYDLTFDKEKGTITWNFPGNSANSAWAKPIYSGANPRLDILENLGFDSELEENRSVNHSINFKTKKILQEYWSATVTSRVLIKDYIATVPYGTIPSTDDWEVVPQDENEEGEYSDYFWFPIATTTTIWQSPPPTAPSPNYCTNLDASLSSDMIDIQGHDAYKINVTNLTYHINDPDDPNFLNGIENVNIKFTSDNVNGGFWDLRTNNDGVQRAIRVGLDSTILNSRTMGGKKIYYTGSPDDIITVEVINTEGDNADVVDPSNPNACKAITEPITTVCTEMSIVPDLHLTRQLEDGNIRHMFKITDVEFSNGRPDDVKVQLISSTHDGTFYIMTRGYRLERLEETSDGVVEINPRNILQGFIYYDTETTDQDTTISIEIVPEEYASLACTDNINLEKIEETVCTSMEIVPDSYVTEELADGNIRHAFVISEAEFSNYTPEDVKIRIISSTHDGTFYNAESIGFNRPLREMSPGIVEIDPTNFRSRTIFYDTENPDQDTRISIIIVPQEYASLACTDNINLEKRELPPVCQSIEINYKSPILEGTYTPFTAQSTDTDGNPYEGNGIRYSVDIPHGTFSQDRPAGVPENPSENHSVRTGNVNPGANDNDSGDANSEDHDSDNDSDGGIGSSIDLESLDSSSNTTSGINIDLLKIANPTTHNGGVNIEEIEDPGLIERPNPTDPPVNSMSNSMDAISNSMNPVASTANNAQSLGQTPAADITIDNAAVESQFDAGMMMNSVLSDSLIFKKEQRIADTLERPGIDPHNTDPVYDPLHPETRKDPLGSPAPSAPALDHDIIPDTPGSDGMSPDNPAPSAPALDHDTFPDTSASDGMAPDSPASGQQKAGRMSLDVPANPSAAEREVFLNALLRGSNVVHVEQLDENGNPIPACSADFSIIGEDAPVCTALEYLINGTANQAEAQRNTINSISASTSFENGEPEENIILYAINADYGVFIQNDALAMAIQARATAGEDLTRELLESVAIGLNLVPANELLQNTNNPSGGDTFHFVIYSNANIAGAENVLRMSAVAPYEAACNASVSVAAANVGLMCTEMNTNLRKVQTDLTGNSVDIPVSAIERGSIYKLEAHSTFQPAGTSADPDMVTVQVSEHYASILNPANPLVADPVTRDLITASIKIGILANQGSLTELTLANTLASHQNSANPPLLVNQVTVEAGTELTIFTYDGAPSASGTISIAQAGTNIPGIENCRESFTIPAIPDTQMCRAMSTSLHSINPNTSGAQRMTITANPFSQIEPVTISSTEVCKLSRTANGQTTPLIMFTAAEVASHPNGLEFYVTCDGYDSTRDSVRIGITHDVNCYDSIYIEPNDIPAPNERCTDLEITRPSASWSVDNEDFDSQNFEIEVDTVPSNYENDLYYHWEVVSGDGEWEENNRSRLTERRTQEQTLEDFNEDTRVRVWASDDRLGNRDFAACEDTIRIKTDKIKRPPEDEANIEKVVYPANRTESFIESSSTNLSLQDKFVDSNSRYLTYMAIVTPGNDTKSLTVQENSMENVTQYANEQRTQRSPDNQPIYGIKGENPRLHGYLEFIGMEIIAVDNFNAKNGEIIYRSPGYIADKSNDSIGDEPYEYDESVDYLCIENDPAPGDLNPPPENTNFCIQADSKAAIETAFKQGHEIQFKNINDLSPDARIIIKYSMKNMSVIDRSSCKDLAASTGCGEEFLNKISFEAYDNNSWSGSADASGSDEARVTVMCPYFITRQGGDSLFYEALPVGIDTSTCGEPNTTIVTKITEPTDNTVVSTGAGEDGGATILELPSHDVCKMSNSEGNLEEYSNVFKNFSSSICEMKSEVAEELFEKNINSAINANITRIARWGDNMSSINVIIGMQNLSSQSISNAQSGVFIKENGDLEIGNNDANAFILEGVEGQINGDIPAAQTYIIRGHDLIINTNIEYGATDYTKPNSIPSAAFIVIDGNIIISPEVTQLDGIYMAINLSDNDKGQIRSKITNDSDLDSDHTADGISKKLLTINGSLIGNVLHLFQNRIASGDVSKNQGSVTIKYDERILLNTPPGIGELVDIQQAIVPN